MNTPQSPNRLLLEAVARRIAPLLGEVVFVGGHMAELLITNPAAVRPRTTDDVDVVVRVATLTKLHEFEERLQALAMRRDTREGAPLCRWRTPEEYVLDVIPTDEDVLGFSNPWYEIAVDTAILYALDDGLAIRGVTGPVFLATKWEAFRGRGEDDYLGSHDVEDIITVVAGRPSLAEEIAAAPADVRRWVASETAAMLASGDGEYAIAGALPDARRIPGLVAAVEGRLRRIAAME